MVEIKSITEKENKAIAEYEALLLKRFPKGIKKLMLFGSKARGDSNRNSDIDILVVVNRDGRRVRKEIVELTFNPIARYGVDLSPIIIKENELKKWSPFTAHIKKEAITIWTSKKNI